MSNLLQHVNARLLFAIGGPGISQKKAERDLIINRTAHFLPDLMRQAEITKPLRIAHFLAQLAHEADGFHTTEEYASGAAYEGRKDLGNVRSGDGKRFKGRGLIQLTGRSNYKVFTDWMRSADPAAPNFETAPDAVAEFPWAVWSAIWFWSTRKLNVVADHDDLLRITRAINGGTNGLADRSARLGRAKAALAAIEASRISEAQEGFRVLYRGIASREDEVARLQTLLAEAGYYHGSIDGIFGAGTDTAVRSFQHRLKLKIDGIVGKQTWSTLIKLLAVDA